MKTLLTSLHLHRPSEWLLPCLQTFWLIWIAAVGLPNWDILIGFFICSYLLYGFMSLAIAAIDQHKPDIKLNRLHTTELLALLLVLIIILDLLTNWLTIWLSLVSFAFLALTLIFHTRIKWLSKICYAGTWAWFAPLAFSAQNKDLETISWLSIAVILCWTLTWRSIQARACSNKTYSNSLPIALLMAASFAFFILIGMLSGQAFWYFGLLLIVFATLLFLLELLHKSKAKQTLLYLPFINVVILAGIILSYSY